MPQLIHDLPRGFDASAAARAQLEEFFMRVNVLLWRLALEERYELWDRGVDERRHRAVEVAPDADLVALLFMRQLQVSQLSRV